MFNKRAPAKETGQIHAIVIPVPKNNLDHPVVVPVCLDTPTVTDHSVYRQKQKLLENLDIHDMTEQEKDEWITMVWDPAHELELAVKDVRKDAVFDWFELLISQINEATEQHTIGKRLQKSESG